MNSKAWIVGIAAAALLGTAGFVLTASEAPHWLRVWNGKSTPAAKNVLVDSAAPSSRSASANPLTACEPARASQSAVDCRPGGALAWAAPQFGQWVQQRLHQR
jgi:hypothetical protein